MLFESIVERGVEDARTTVDEVIELGDFSRREAIDLLRDLAKAGCGDFKVGRKGHPSRLEWSVDPSHVAMRIVNGGLGDKEGEDEAGEHTPTPDPQPEPLAPPSQAALDLGQPAEPSEDRPPPHSKRRQPAARGMIDHTHVLRPDLRVTVTLPADLSPAEATVLADWVRNLSFQR